MTGDLLSIGEILRRAQLARQLSGQGDQTVPQVSPQDQVPPPQQFPQRDQALEAYRSALAQPAPKQSDYHPSVGRRIAGALLGGIAGLHDPKTGFTVGQGVSYAPYNRAMSDYERNLEQKKEAFGVEEKAAEGTQKFEVEDVKKRAELARMGAEGARRESELAKRRKTDWENSPEGRQFILDKIKLQHKQTGKIPTLYKLTTEDGDILATEDEKGRMLDPYTDEIIPQDSYSAKEVYKLGTEPKPSSEKETGEDKDLDAFAVEKYGPGKTNKDLTAKDRDEFRTRKAAAVAKGQAQFPKPQAPPEIVDPTGRISTARPGTVFPPGSRTITQAGSESVESAPTKQMRETAPKVIDLAKRSLKDIDAQVNSLGPMKSRWSEFMAGKVGAPNPEFTKLRTNIMLLQTLLMRMHLGARGGSTMSQHFRDLIDVGRQDPENLKAALGEIVAYANDIRGIKEEVVDQGNTLPGGVTMDEINAEIERRKKTNTKK